MARNKLEDAKSRARIISTRIRSRMDEAAREKIASFAGKLSWTPEDCGIDRGAWRRVEEIGVSPQLVFAHPDLLLAHPDASLHYRGIATLSLKRVQQIAGSVDVWEKEPRRARGGAEKALRVARLYNAIISSIILDSTDWTMENGYRNILATMGITSDGALRNIIGQEAERAVKEKIAEWLENRSGIPFAPEEARAAWRLGAGGGLRMVYSSEPDIRFEKATGKGGWEVISTIEVKGGADPAGALERLGAVKKSFDKTPARSKNFLILGVETGEMRAQLNEMRIEKVFDLFETLHNDARWREFLNEAFHHTLRALRAPLQRSPGDRARREASPSAPRSAPLPLRPVGSRRAFGKVLNQLDGEAARGGGVGEGDDAASRAVGGRHREGDALRLPLGHGRPQIVHGEADVVQPLAALGDEAVERRVGAAHLHELHHRPLRLVEIEPGGVAGTLIDPSLQKPEAQQILHHAPLRFQVADGAAHVIDFRHFSGLSR